MYSIYCKILLSVVICLVHNVTFAFLSTTSLVSYVKCWSLHAAPWPSVHCLLETHSSHGWLQRLQSTFQHLSDYIVTQYTCTLTTDKTTSDKATVLSTSLLPILFLYFVNLQIPCKAFDVKSIWCEKHSLTLRAISSFRNVKTLCDVDGD